MPRLTVVVSGPVGAGKTELATRLAGALRGEVVSTRQVLADEYHVHHRDENRGRLQQLGDQLDRETNGRWVAEAVLDHTKFFRPSGVVIVDAVRRESQIDELRESVTPHVFHIHVTAPERVLTERYRKKQEARKDKELTSFAEVRANLTEAHIGELGSRANMRINTRRWPPWATFARARFKIWRSALWSSRRRLARSGAWGLMAIAAILLLFLGVPILDVTAFDRTTALAIAYAFLLLAIWLLIAWALTGQSPVAGLPRRDRSRVSRADDEAES